MAKNKIYLDGADLTEKEKNFIHEITPLLKEKMWSLLFSRFGDFLRTIKISELRTDHFPMVEIIRQAQKKVGLVELSPKLIRAVELLSVNQSPRPLTNNPTDWKWSEYHKYFYHRGCHEMIRYELDGVIHKIAAIHNFPKPQYAYWQGYATSRLVKRNEFPINPLVESRDIFYYAEPWDGLGPIEDRIAQSTLLQHPEFAEGWITIQRTAFKKEVMELCNISKRLLGC